MSSIDFGKFCNDPEQSWTLPSHLYHEQSVFDLEMEKIFAKNWQYACHESVVDQPGKYFVRDIGHQSVLVIRDQNKSLKAYYNVCQHRAHRLLEAEGQIGKLITCPYHSWCYRLDGKLQHAPGCEGVEAFPQDIHLQPVKLDTLCGFIFFNMDQAASSMAETYPGLEADILALAPNAATLKRAHSQNFELKANWKNSIENYSECYHCPNRHPSLVNSALDIEQYKILVRDGYHRHVTTDVGDKQGYQITQSDDPTKHEFGSWFVWPNMVFEVYPGGNLTVFHHVPTAPETTRQETEWYFPNDKPDQSEQAVIDFINTVREEDIPICESVQKGLHSKGYNQGRFIVDNDRSYVSEHAVHDFQHRVASALSKP